MNSSNKIEFKITLTRDEINLFKLMNAVRPSLREKVAKEAIFAYLNDVKTEKVFSMYINKTDLDDEIINKKSKYDY